MYTPQDLRMRAHHTVFNKASVARPDCHETAVIDDSNSVFFQLHKPLYARVRPIYIIYYILYIIRICVYVCVYVCMYMCVCVCVCVCVEE